MSTSPEDEDKGKVLRFPNAKERREREALEEEYRRQYRAERKRENNPSFINWHKIPLVSRWVVGAFIVAFLGSSFLLDDAQRLVLYMNFGFVPAYYSSAIPWSWSALVAPLTTVFIHGGWMHLLTNCIMMLAMGVFFERQYGSRIALIFFVVSALCGDLTYFLINPTLSAPVVGASGGISGLFGGMLMTMNVRGVGGPKAQKFGPYTLVLLWVAIMLGFGLISSDTAWQSHLGGFLGGVALFQLWRKGKIRL
jgi:membrane associated rhomboid family serine protease